MSLNLKTGLRRAERTYTCIRSTQTKPTKMKHHHPCAVTSIDKRPLRSGDGFFQRCSIFPGVLQRHPVPISMELLGYSKRATIRCLTRTPRIGGCDGIAVLQMHACKRLSSHHHLSSRRLITALGVPTACNQHGVFHPNEVLYHRRRRRRRTRRYRLYVYCN